MQTDWKVAAAAIIGLSVVASALIFSGNENVAGFFTVFSERPAETPFSAQFNINDKFALEISDSTSLVLELKSPNANIQLGKERLDIGSVDSVNVKVDGFSGKITFGSGIALKGSGKKVFLNGIGSKERTSISIDSQNFENLQAVNATVKPFSHEMTGSVDVESGKTIIKLEDDLVQLSGFTGGISATLNDFILSGKAARISVAGKFNIG